MSRIAVALSGLSYTIPCLGIIVRGAPFTHFRAVESSMTCMEKKVMPMPVPMPVPMPSYSTFFPRSPNKNNAHLRGFLIYRRKRMGGRLNPLCLFRKSVCGFVLLLFTPHFFSFLEKSADSWPALTS